ncbi:putative nuclease HARBI1 [Bicyclus anynana]|uniref:Nuclease HARBI1 n=1 Tax=Bicyclus anynana TaxID=110368 RepID=A0A6J1NT41_BICAN|nr:putative nuclease HARBI1 [Bicyclus anynana]
MSLMYLLWQAEKQRKRNVSNSLSMRRRLRDLSDPLKLPEKQFIAMFRVDKSTFQRLLVELRARLPDSKRSTAVRKELKILAALNFYAKGAYQRSIGACDLNSMSQPTFSRCFNEVTDALNSPDILQKYIKFPVCQADRKVIINGFMEKFGFPGVIGCVDGMQVAILQPKKEKEAFFNDNNYYSLNVLIICDAKLNILYVDASFSGASTDEQVWEQCAVKEVLQNIPETRRCWLLGDSEYPQGPRMLTLNSEPIPDISRHLGAESYVELHHKTWNTVQECMKALRERWQCLKGRKPLHYGPTTAAKIVNACVVLHNIANLGNVPLVKSSVT